jgi:hypothetical protein
MSPRVSLAVRLQRAREKGSESKRNDINNIIMPGKIVPDTEKNYNNIIDVFNA